MELMQAIQERRSIRKFKTDPVNPEDLREMVQAAVLAPNASNKQMWKFVAVTNKQVLQQIGAAVSRRVDVIINACKTLDRGQEFAKHKYFLTFFEHAPAVIAVFVGPYKSAVDDALGIIHMKYAPSLEISPAQQSIGAAVENLSLVAHAKGYGTTWMYGPVLAHQDIAAILNVQEPWVLAALLPVGVPDQRPAARPRKPLDEVYRLID